MKTSQSLILCLLLIANLLHAQSPGNPAAGQDASAQLATLQAPLRAVAEEVEKSNAALQQRYQAALDQLQSERASAGDLDGVIAIKAERDRIERRDPTTPAQIQAMSPLLRNLRANYDATLKKIADDAVVRTDLARRKYLADLEALQKRITMSGNFDQALLVKAEKDRFIAEMGKAVPKASPTPTTIPTPPPPLGSATAVNAPGSAVKALIAGSRWQWFDGPDFNRKAYWAEFYKDGTARTSWGTGHTWEILPPATVHIYQPSDKRNWYFDVDVAKRVAFKNPELDKNNNCMRYEKRISTPPSKAKK